MACARILYVISLLNFSVCCGQESLILNPGFEEYTECPNDISQFDNCLDWITPTLGTSDLYHLCSGSGTPISLGANIIGYQFPKEGNGMAGILAESVDVLDDTTIWYREYLTARLSKPLESGQHYKLNFYVSLANNVLYASSKIGAYFSKESPISDTSLPLFYSPQIVNETGFLKDTLNWMSIGGEFIANGGEEFLTIGIFDSEVDTLFLFDTTSPKEGHSYYYVDGLSLINKSKNFNVAISPNGDGINDEINFNQVISSNLNSLMIYNRWGKLVFDCRHLNCIWDGKLNNQELPDGTYFYFATESNSNTTIKGIIHLFN